MDFVQVVSGQSFSCGIDVDQAVMCWGGMSVPKNPPGLFKQVSADSSSHFACGILIDNSISCWGIILGDKFKYSNAYFTWFIVSYHFLLWIIAFLSIMPSVRYLHFYFSQRSSNSHRRTYTYIYVILHWPLHCLIFV